jgi:hypothetical protein
LSLLLPALGYGLRSPRRRKLGISGFHTAITSIFRHDDLSGSDADSRVGDLSVQAITDGAASVEDLLVLLTAAMILDEISLYAP